jgi:hypothetical protein
MPLGQNACDVGEYMPLVCLLVRRTRYGKERTKALEDCQGGDVRGIQEMENCGRQLQTTRS